MFNTYIIMKNCFKMFVLVAGLVFIASCGNKPVVEAVEDEPIEVVDTIAADSVATDSLVAE